MAITYTLKLHKGTSDTGKETFYSLGLGKMSLIGFNVGQAADLATLLKPLLNYSNTGGEHIQRKIWVS